MNKGIKLAAWWLIIINGVTLIYNGRVYLSLMNPRGLKLIMDALYFFFFMVANDFFNKLLFPLIFLVSGIYLLKKKRWAWILAIVTLSVLIVSHVTDITIFTPTYVFFGVLEIPFPSPYRLLFHAGDLGELMISIIILVIPLMLLLINRRNFFLASKTGSNLIR